MQYIKYIFAFAALSLVLGYMQTESPTTRTPSNFGNLSEIVPSTKSEKSVLLNDPSMQKNWAFNDAIKSNVKASKAWQITQGSRDIVVAVIDTGIDVDHPDLKANLWRNPGEIGKDAKGRDKATNGLDDDNNGYIDDVHGWNFVGNNNDLSDNHGHGTHVAGIIGAEGGNGIGISGIAPKVSLMVLKYYDPKSTFNNNLGNTIKAIKYANKMGAKIINYSGGGNEFSSEEFKAVKESYEKGILIVAAAGNEHNNSDEIRYYPASYKLDNIISVTAIDPKTRVLSSSNYGTNTVHIAAPGKNIFSTIPGGKYGLLTGTSQAAPLVTGVAALIYANNPKMDYQDVKKQILSTADYDDSLKGKTKTAGILNSWAALAMQGTDRTITGGRSLSTQSFYASEETSNSDNNNINDLAELVKAFTNQL